MSPSLNDWYKIMEKLDRIKPYNPIVERYDIRLDANESFFDLPKSAKKEIAKRLQMVEYNRYPDPFAITLCNNFASFCNVPAQNVVASNGSDEIISVIFQTFCVQNDNVLMFTPEFSMYEFYCNLLSLKAIKIPKKPNFHIDFVRAEKLLATENIKLCILSNPCNPTSIQEKKENLKRLLKFDKTLFVIDEAYMDFATESFLDEFQNYDNLIVLKTLSKACNLAAARVGFAISNYKIINILKSTKSPYNVNSLSQVVANILLENPKFIQKNIAKIKQNTRKLKKELQTFEGFEVIKGNTNFVTIKTQNAEEIDEFLRKKSISIRKFDGFLRITCGSQEENKKLIEVLKLCVRQK